jgi:hypothetical protein
MPTGSRSRLPHRTPCWFSGTFALLVATLTTAVQAERITPVELRQHLASPAAQYHLQQLSRLRASSLDSSTLTALQRDAQLTTPAREWLLQHALQVLREQAPTPETEQWVQSLTSHVSQTQLLEEFEGRLRDVPLAPLAQNAHATLRWWQQQADAEHLQQHWLGTEPDQLAARWSQLPEATQAAWLLAVSKLNTEQISRSQISAPETLAQNASPFAAALAARSTDTLLRDAVLRYGKDEASVRLLQQLRSELQQAETYPSALDAALANPILRSQAWYLVAARHDTTAKQRMHQAISTGDFAATAALVQHAGADALPTLQQQLQSKTEKAQLAAIYGLRLLATEDAKRLLQQQQKNASLSERARRELQP